MQSLLRYDTPVLVNAQGKRATAIPSKGRAGLPPVDKPLTQTDEILSNILPPREYEEDGQKWIQRVSSTPATRLDVINTQEMLDKLLIQRQARENGICPVREELYNQAFDEIIRQVTINCAERGFLLLRVRDELRMRIAAYQTLYESSIAFGLRKALQAEQGKTETEEKINRLLNDKKDLERQVAELKNRLELKEKQDAEKRQIEEKKHQEEVAFLKRSLQQVKTQLETLFSAKGKEH